MIQGVVCGFLSTVLAGVAYMTSGASSTNADIEHHENSQMPVLSEHFHSVTKEPTRSWFKLSSEGTWIQLRPELEQSVEDAYMSGEESVDMGKYTIHFNSERGQWKLWLENTEKETFTKLKYEEG